MDLINTKGLSKEDMKTLQDMIEFFRKRHLDNKSDVKIPRKTKKIEFRSSPLGVKGNITREEIYDYL